MCSDGPSEPASDDASIPVAEVVDETIADAEILDQAPPHPLRFGLRALFILTAVCCVQFALMSYIGALAGLAVGFAVCLAALGCLLLAQISLQLGRSSRPMIQMDRLAIRLTIAVVLLAIGTILAGGGQLVYYQVTQYRFTRNLEKDLGFSAEMGQVTTQNLDEFGRYAIVVRSVTPGGAFDQAGFQKNDVIVTDLTVDEYYEMLDENRGQQINVTVASGAVGIQPPPLEQCPQRQLTLDVPP